MRQLKFTYGGKTYHVILRECPDNISDEVLQKVAMQCCLEIVKAKAQKNDAKFTQRIQKQQEIKLFSPAAYDESKTRTIFIKQLRQSLNSDPLFQYVYIDGDHTEKNKLISEAVISSTSLKADITYEFQFDEKVPALEKNYSHPALDVNSDDTNNWVLQPRILESLFAEKTELPIKLETMPFLSEFAISTCDYEEVVDQLCTKLNLSSDHKHAAQHLKGKNLSDEFRSRANSKECLDLYDEWVTSELRDHKDLQDLPAFLPPLQTYKADIINAAKKQVLAFKTLAVTNYINGKEQDKQYLKKITESQPREFLALQNKIDVLRKNILIALYNAARLRYNAIIGQYNKKKDRQQLNERIEHFNKTFEKKIAWIDPKTLQLSKLERLIEHQSMFPSLTTGNRPSLEAFVNVVLIDMAEDQDALTLVYEQLEQLQRELTATAGTDNPRLFNEICEPTSTNIVKSAFNNVKSILIQKEYKFSFTPACSILTAKVSEAENEFRNNLAVISSLLDGFDIEINEILAQKDGTITKYFSEQRAKILALHSTLQEASELDQKISNELAILTQLQQDADKAYQHFTKFNARLAQYDISPNELNTFRTQFLCDDDAWKEPETFSNNIIDIRGKLINAQEAVSQVEKNVLKNEPLDASGTNKNLAELINIKVGDIHNCRNKAAQIKTEVQSRTQDQPHLKNWTYVTKRIDQYLELIAQCELAIKQLEDSATLINKFLSLASVSPDENITENINFARENIEKDYEEVTRHITELAKATSKDNCIITALINKQKQAKKRAEEALEKRKKDTYDLARCHLAMNGVFDFDYWQAMLYAREPKVSVRGRRNANDENIRYNIPTYIFNLVELSCDPACKDWAVNPEHARALMTKMRTKLTKTVTPNHYNQFKSLLLDEIIPDVEGNTPDLTSLDKPRNSLADLMRRQSVAPLQRKPFFHQLTVIPPFFEKNPNAYRILTGVVVGLVIATAATLLCLGLIYGGAAPALAIGIGTIMHAGGPGLVTLFTLIVAGIITATCAAINTICDFGRETLKPASDRMIIETNDCSSFDPAPSSLNVSAAMASQPQKDVLRFGAGASLNSNNTPLEGETETNSPKITSVEL